VLSHCTDGGLSDYRRANDVYDADVKIQLGLGARFYMAKAALSCRVSRGNEIEKVA
jgi:hypothetical protein